MQFIFSKAALESTNQIFICSLTYHFPDLYSILDYSIYNEYIGLSFHPYLQYIKKSSTYLVQYAELSLHDQKLVDQLNSETIKLMASKQLMTNTTNTLLKSVYQGGKSKVTLLVFVFTILDN